MDTCRVYAVEGYSRFDKKNGMYYDVRKIEVIATSEKEALERAPSFIKCNFYKVFGCYERQIVK